MIAVRYWRQHRDNGAGKSYCGRTDGELWGDWGETDCRDCLRIGCRLGLYTRRPGWRRRWPRTPITRRPRTGGWS